MKKIKFAGQLLSYNKKDGRVIPYVMLDGIICRTQNKAIPDTDGNLIGEFTVELQAIGTMINGVATTSESYNFISYTPDSLLIKQAENNLRMVLIDGKTTACKGLTPEQYLAYA